MTSATGRVKSCCGRMSTKRASRSCPILQSSTDSLRPHRWSGRDSPEAVRAGKAAGDEPAGGAAGAEPRAEVGFGADAVFALAPGEAVGEAEHLAIGETTRFVALQDDASAACHQRY